MNYTYLPSESSTSSVGVASFLLALVLAIAGCSASGGGTSSSSIWASSSSTQRIDTRLLQLDLMNYSDRFVTRMSDGYDQLADVSSSASAKAMALDRKIDGATAAYGNAVNPNPLVGLMDMLVMVRLVRESSEEPWFAQLFGEPGRRIAVLLKTEEEDISRIGAKYLTESQLSELRDATDRWRHDHPNHRYIAMASISDFPEAAAKKSSDQNGPGSVFGLLFLDPLSGLDPAVREVERSRETAERMFFYLQRMPLLISWGAEAASHRMLAAPQVQQFVNNTSSFATSFGDSSKRFADTVQQFPQFLTAERERSLQQLAHVTAEERTAAVKQLADAVAVERNAAIHQSADAIGAQRDAAVRQVAGAVSLERERAIEQFKTSIQSQREGFARDMETAWTRSINRFFVLAIVLVVIGVCTTTLAILILRRKSISRR